MGNLFLSFSIAVAAAIGVVSMSRTLDLDFYIGRTLPLIPILYAIVYEFLDHKKRGKGKILPRSREIDEPVDKKSETAVLERLAVGRVITGVGISFFVKFFLEMFLVALFLRISDQSFSEVYGTVSIETVGRFLRGEHPWLSGREGVYMLALIALFTCFITGLWIGYTSKGKAILEGVLVGAAVTVVLSMTNMLILFQQIEGMTVRFADSMGYVLRAGFVVVISLQVLLYGLWSGLVQMGKEERLKQTTGKTSVKRVRK
jgi:hypothetical protein